MKLPLLVRRKLETIDCYDTITNKWASLTRIPGGPRVGAAVNVFHDQLYVVGGFIETEDESNILNDVASFSLINQMLEF